MPRSNNVTSVFTRMNDDRQSPGIQRISYVVLPAQSARGDALLCMSACAAPGISRLEAYRLIAAVHAPAAVSSRPSVITT